MHSYHRSLAARLGGLLLVTLLAVASCTTDREPTSPSDGTPGLAQGPDFSPALVAQANHTARYLKKAGIEGTGVTLTADGRPAVVFFTRHQGVAGIPASLDGVPVVVQVTGEFQAILPRARPGGGGKPTDRLARPVPIGISIGNIGECSAGTLGARVRGGGGQLYVLSNNHVLALENDAAIGSDILQPGRYDTRCASSVDDVIADLSKFQAIDFGGGNNTVDAAIAGIRSGAVGNATMSAGYGLPGSTPVTASVNQAVQKCGRTTGCTKGTVTAINATVNVNYGAKGVATFVNQVVITGKKGAFSKAGDSGSLIVTDNAAASPVALLFAGGQTTTIGNPIGAVLQSMGVSIDGK